MNKICLCTSTRKKITDMIIAVVLIIIYGTHFERKNNHLNIFRFILKVLTTTEYKLVTKIT